LINFSCDKLEIYYFNLMQILIIYLVDPFVFLWPNKTLPLFCYE